MPVIAIFGGSFCSEDQVVREIRSTTGYDLIADRDVVADASRIGNLPEGKLERVFSGRTSIFNRFTREKERSLADLRLALAGRLEKNNLIVAGFAGQLVPREIQEVLRVCLIADTKARVAACAEALKISESDALKRIHREDEERGQWIRTLFGSKDPWDESLYDIVFPTDKMSPSEIALIVEQNIVNATFMAAGGAKGTLADFKTAATVESALIEEGHDVVVEARSGVVTLTIDKHVLMLNRLEEELKAIAGKVPGVETVETKVGPGYYQADIYRRQDFESPSRILLVDDEKRYAQTLSKRLMMRDLGSTVVYDGESALKVARDDEPEVMILDLRMPGIDGIEVLQQVKRNHPEIEVIVLTGQGSEADRKTCLELGAFAYLEKSVDIDRLSEEIKAAHEKIRLRRAGVELVQKD